MAQRKTSGKTLNPETSSPAAPQKIFLYSDQKALHSLHPHINPDTQTDLLLYVYVYGMPPQTPSETRRAETLNDCVSAETHFHTPTLCCRIHHVIQVRKLRINTKLYLQRPPSSRISALLCPFLQPTEKDPDSWKSPCTLPIRIRQYPVNPFLLPPQKGRVIRSSVFMCATELL